MKLLGLNTDSSESNIPFGYWSKAVNVVLSYDLTALVTEKGFKVISENVPSTHRNIGIAEIRNRGFLLFSIVDDYSEIGLLSYTGSYKNIIRLKAFRFNPMHPIRRIVYQINPKGQAIVAFTDAHEKPHLINIDSIGVDVDADNVLIDETDAVTFNLFPDFSSGIFELDSVSTGGSLLSGVYHIVAAYIDSNDNATDWGNISGPINITRNDDGRNDGSLSNQQTNKVINFRLTDLDTRYKAIRIAYIYKQNGKVNSYTVGDYNISDSISLTLSGQEAETLIDNSEILVDRISYNTVGDIAQINNRLYAADLTTNDTISYQPYANNIKAEYVKDEFVRWDNNKNYRNPVFTFYKRQFFPGEVYALYIGFGMTDGTASPWYHIPGRAPKQIVPPNEELENAYNRDLLYLAPYLQDDVNVAYDSKYFQMRDTSGDHELGFWENENEFYDDTANSDILSATGQVGTLRNRKVRHHKMPDRDKLAYEEHLIEILGIRLYDIYIPDEILAKIVDIKIGYAKRNTEDITILGQSVLIFESEAIRQDEDGYNEYTDEELGNNTLNVNYGQKDLRRDYIRFKSFDLMLNKPRINPSYIRNLYKLPAPLETLVREYDAEGGAIFTPDSGGGKPGSYLMRLDLQAVNGEPIAEEHKIRKVNNAQYLDHNSVLDSFYKNEYGDETYIMQIEGGDTLPLTVPSLETQNTVSGTHETYLSNLCNYLRNVFVTYKKQNVLQTGKITRTSSSNTYDITSFGGDAYVGSWSWRAQGEAFNTRRDADDNVSIRTIIHLYTDMWSNSNLRHMTSDPLTRYYPETDIYQLLNPIDKGAIFEKYRIEYNSDWSSLNEFNISGVFDGKEKPTTFSNTIIRSETQQNESSILGWRKFPANAAYIVDRTFGRVVGIQPLGNSLLIRTEAALLKTVDSTALKTGEEDIKLGSADIFSIDPEAVRASDNGVAGCQSYFGAILTPFGYLVVDSNQKRIFLYSGELNDVTDELNRAFFEANLGMQFNEQMSRLFDTHYNIDNPLIGIGILVGYDEENKRILVTKRDMIIKPEYEHRFKGNYEDNQAFLDSLTPGDIVMKDGKLAMFKGR